MTSAITAFTITKEENEMMRNDGKTLIVICDDLTGQFMDRTKLDALVYANFEDDLDYAKTSFDNKFELNEDDGYYYYKNELTTNWLTRRVSKKKYMSKEKFDKKFKLMTLKERLELTKDKRMEDVKPDKRLFLPRY